MENMTRAQQYQIMIAHIIQIHKTDLQLTGVGVDVASIVKELPNGDFQVEIIGIDRTAYTFRVASLTLQ